MTGSPSPGRLRDVERDEVTLRKVYARMVPEALDRLTGEERHQVYRVLRHNLPQVRA